jgi:hypothetical protein
VTRIRLHEHPFSGQPAREFEAACVGQWLIDHYGPTPQVGVQVFVGEPSAQTEITRDIRALVASEAEAYTVLQSPGLEAIGFALYYIETYGLQVLASYAVSRALQPSIPDIPTLGNNTISSPNNQLGARENSVRIGSRIEDIFGRVRAIPSLMMPSYRKYIDHRLVEFGYYCIGRGWYQVAASGATYDIKDGDSLIADIPGSSVAVYNPFTSPNGGSPIIEIGDPIIDPVLTVRRSVQVDGTTLKAANQVQLASPQTWTFTPDAGGDRLTQTDKAPNANAVAEAGDQVTITLAPQTYTAGNDGLGTLTMDATAKTITSTLGTAFAQFAVGDVVTSAGWSNAGNNGSITITSKPSAAVIGFGGTGYVDETSGTATAAVTRDFSGTRTIASVADGLLVLTTSTWESTYTGSAAVLLSGKSEWSAWITIPTADRTEVWCNILAQQGIFKDGGGGKATSTVAFEIQIERLDADDLTPTGTVETVTGSLTGATSDERAETVERATAWTGPARVRMRRTTAYDYAFSGTVIDEIKWTDLYGVSPVSKTHFGNLTTIHSVTVATPRATAARQRQLNALVTRRLPTWSGSAWSGVLAADGSIASGAISATTRMVDILAAVTIDPTIGGRSIAELDVAQVYGVQQLLDALHEDAGQFSLTFDSDNLSYEETAQTIANACFCIAYRQSGKIRLALDRPQSTSVALLTHRNKRPQAIEPERITRTFANDSEYDGIEMRYQDPDTERAETIVLPRDAAPTKPKKLEIPGIRSFPQAWLRANREYRKLLGQRMSIETAGTTDARLLLPGARVDIVDNTRFKAYDGEVLAQDGLTLTLSQPVAFTPAASHSIVLMKRNGTLQSITCTAGPTDRQVVLATAPAEAIVTEHGPDGVRTIFSFAADTARGAMAWLVTEVEPPRDGYVVLRAINYSSDYYAADDDEIPAAASVIN